MTTFQALGHLHEMRRSCEQSLKHHEGEAATHIKDDLTSYHVEEARKHKNWIAAIDKVGALLSKRG